jgi:hypothetical protein
MNAAQTPWQAGRFDTRHGPAKILFGRMYEDAAIELAAFPTAGRVVCIASAGCMAMALATRHEVTAIDINPTQLAYAKDRVAGAPMRVGSAERLMGVGRAMMAVFGWRRKTLEAFLALDDTAEQMRFWNARLNTLGFRASTDLALSLAALGAVYASPFLDVVPRHFGQVMRSRLERCFAAHPNRGNPYARALLIGDPVDTRPRAPIGPIEFVCADVAGYLESCAPHSVDGFTMSNILDGAPPEYRARLAGALQRAGRPGSVVVLRSFGEPLRPSATNHAALDRSILWGLVDIRPAAGWT